MRNVSIWTNEDWDWETPTTPVCIRLFQYKGVKNTLNEFLSPDYIHRGTNLAPRHLDVPGRCTFFDDKVKGQVVLMGYNGISLAEEGRGEPYKVFPSFERAVHWLIKNGYEFYGYESATKRARKIKAMDFEAEQKIYVDMAREVEKSLIKPVTEQAPRKLEIVPAVAEDRTLGNAQTIKPPVPPIPPASRLLNDQGAPVKEKTKKPTFIDNMMKFLRLFKK